MRNGRKRLFSCSVACVLTFLIVSLSLLPQEEREMVVANILEVHGTTIVIGNNQTCKAIVAQTSPERARNILLGMHGIIPERPTTHDTIAEIFRQFNLTLEKVTIEKFSGNYYYGYMYIRAKNKMVKLDVMPSDGIAVALRLHAPIYLNKTLLEEVGENVC